MEFSSIFHEPTRTYAWAESKNNFTIRIRTKKTDIKSIFLHFEDKYLPVDLIDTRQKAAMEKTASDRWSDYWEIHLTIDVICLRYFFELIDMNDLTIFMGNSDFYNSPVQDRDLMFDLPQNLREEESFSVPAWAPGKVVYQIFSARFGQPENVPESVWIKENLTRQDTFSGTLKGITDRLEYLKNLGVDVIYLTPVFKSPSIHKYDTIDYYEIDENLGTKEDFKNLVEKVHSLGMKIMLDGVFNHTSRKFFAFADLIKNGEKSPYKNWYYIDSFPIDEISFHKKPNFKSFAYFGGMPKTNLQNPETAEYFTKVAEYWIKEFNIDGWRLDVADEIHHDFWKNFRKRIKNLKPDALITGECWHYAPDFLDGTQWDSSMNYPFYNAVRDFVINENITASKFLEKLDFLKGNYFPAVNSVLWNHIDTHDTPRFLHQAGDNKIKLHLAAAFQMLSEGMPMIYYGDEIGLNGAQDPDNRRGMIWNPELQDLAMLDWYKNLISVRKNYPAVYLGKTVSKEAFNSTKTIIITKELNGKRIFIVFSASKTPVELNQFNGKKDLITGENFSGTISMDAKVFEE